MVRTQPLYAGHMLFQLSYWGALWALFDIGSVCNIAGSNSLVKSSHSKLCSRTPPPSSAFIRLLLCAHKYCYLCHMWCVRATLTSIFPLSWWCLVAQRLPEQSTCVGAHRDWKSLYLKYWICCFIITTSPSLQSTCTCCSQLYQFVFLLYLEAVECFPCIKTWLKHYFAKSPPRIKNACRGENVHFQNILYFTNFRFMQTDA